MTDSIILCEGETDQALVGCYMEKVAGWRYIKNAKEEPFPNESTHWYHDSNGYMDGIWQVGGNEFSKALSSIFGREKLEHSIERIVIITDHDDQGAETNRLSEIKGVIETVLGDQLIDIQLLTNQWGSILFRDPFKEARIQLLYLLIPVEEYGALETYMMNALSEQSKDKKHVIEESKTFIDGFQSDVYLKHRREKIKAELGVSLSIFSPDRIFTTMKELIDSVAWEDFSETHKQFELLKRLY